jgi:hypothetical protein
VFCLCQHDVSIVVTSDVGSCVLLYISCSVGWFGANISCAVYGVRIGSRCVSEQKFVFVCFPIMVCH